MAKKAQQHRPAQTKRTIGNAGSTTLSWADKQMEHPFGGLIFVIAPLFLIPMLDPEYSVFSLFFVILAGFTTLLIYNLRKEQPWAWMLLAVNPLFIINGIHTIDFYVKAIYIGFILALAFLFTKPDRKKGAPWEITLPEMLWLVYMVWGSLAMLWSVQPVLGFERLIYLGFGIGAYVIGKQTRFWKSTAFWNVFALVAMVVSAVGICMWFFSGTKFIGFDWIMSAGRPSSTLSYRAYASTYLLVTLPFLFWFMFSKHIKNTGHFVFAALSFFMTTTFLAHTRARSGWLALYIGLYAMMIIMTIRNVSSTKHKRRKPKKETVLLIVISALVGGFIVALSTDVKAGFTFGETGAMNGLLITFLLGVQASSFLFLLIFNAIIHWDRIAAPRNAIAIGLGGATLIVIMFFNASDYLIKGDTNPQKLDGTGKVTAGDAVNTLFKSMASGRSDRLDFWAMSRRMMFEKSVRGEFEGPGGIPHWVLGVGIGQFPVHVPLYSDILHSLGAEIHNDWIQALVELGPIGFLSWTLFMLILLYYAVRNWNNGLMIACVGCIVAWVMSTMTDFLTARIYGIVWLGGVVAMIHHEARIRPIISLKNMAMPRIARVGAAVFFIWLAAGYYITAHCDRQIFRTLTQNNPPVDQVLQDIFDDGFTYRDGGIGKYLIFSPISDLSRALSTKLQEMEQQKQDMRLVLGLQRKIAAEILWMHPYNYNAMAVMTNIAFKDNKLDVAQDWCKQYLDIKPNDPNMWMFLAQTQLNSKDSLDAAESVYRAMQINPNLPVAQQFWQSRISQKFRQQVLDANQQDEPKQEAALDNSNP